MSVSNTIAKSGSGFSARTYFWDPPTDRKPSCGGGIDNAERTELDPGKVSVAIDGETVVDDARSFARIDEPMWHGAGELVIVTTAGGDVPAFSGMVVTPATVVVGPVEDFFSHFSSDPPPVHVSWSGGVAGDTVHVWSEEGLDYAWCDFPAEAGHGTIPSEVVALAPSGELDPDEHPVTIGVATYRSNTVRVGDRNVDLTAVSPATLPSGEVAVSSF